MIFACAITIIIITTLYITLERKNNDLEDKNEYLVGEYSNLQEEYENLKATCQLQNNTCAGINSTNSTENCEGVRANLTEINVKYNLLLEEKNKMEKELSGVNSKNNELEKNIKELQEENSNNKEYLII